MGDLSITGLYTSACWSWAGFAGADLLDDPEARRVFGVTNAALGMAGLVRRWPSLPHSLAQRHVMIDRVVAEARPRAVLELGAGLSARGLRMTGADPDLTYVEVDRPAVLARKRRLLERSQPGREALARPRWRFTEADLETADLAALAPPEAPLAVVAEGVLMYLDAVGQRALWRRVRELFAARDGVFTFDLVPANEQPPPGLVGRSLRWVMKRFTGGATFSRDERGRADVCAELGEAGFTAEAVEPRAAPAAWAVPHLERRTQMLVFVARPRPTR